MKAHHPDISARIASVERRLERRRTRLLDDFRESTGAASQAATKVVPVAAALGAGIVALYLTRKFTARRPPPPTYSEYRARYGEPQRRGLRWGQLAGVVATAFRIGTSPQFRAFWQGYRRARERRSFGHY